MRKRTRPRNEVPTPNKAIPNAIQAPELKTHNEKYNNGLSEAIMGPGIGGGINPIGYPGSQGSPWSEQISQPTTVFKNLRWYLVSNMRQMLSEAYVEIGLIQAICNIPVDDALRGGVLIKSKQLDEEEIEKLTSSLDRDDDLATVGQAAVWNRLFGGAAVLVLTDQDPETEIDLGAIDEDTPLEFRAIDMWELYWDKQNTEGYDPTVQLEDFEYYSYYGEKVHKSRVMRMTGLTAPSFVRPRLRGWGFSVVEILVRSINQYLKATDLGFEVLDEFKLDVYKIKNLTNTLLSPIGEEKVARRIQLANYQKNYQNAVVMDSEDEYDHKQLSFAGLAEAMAGIRMQVASDMRMPLTKLFGISAAGFNSGEDDIEVYNAMVESQVRDKIKYIILRLIEIKCQKLFGFIPDDLTIEFQALRIMTSEQEETVKAAKFTRLQTALERGWITFQEFRDACNKGKLFDIHLDTSVEMEGGYMDDTVGEDDKDPYKTTDDSDPGANRIDSRKPKVFEEGGIASDGSVKPPKDSKQPKPKKPDDPKADMTKAKKTNVVMMPPRFTRFERIERALRNSAAFDRAAYAADGGDAWIDPRRKELFMNPGSVDEALWAKAKEASRAAFGEERWQFITWWYKKQGGKFHSAA